MKTSLFDYDLPQSYIAQQPAEPRDSSRLLVLHRKTGEIEHRIFREIGEYLESGDLLVGNDSRVIPARLHGHKATGGAVEIFLLRQLDDTGIAWQCLVRGRKLVEGVVIWLQERQSEEEKSLLAEIMAVEGSGTRIVHFSEPIQSYFDELGEIPTQVGPWR